MPDNQPLEGVYEGLQVINGDLTVPFRKLKLNAPAALTLTGELTMGSSNYAVNGNTDGDPTTTDPENEAGETVAAVVYPPRRFRLSTGAFYGRKVIIRGWAIRSLGSGGLGPNNPNDIVLFIRWRIRDTSRVVAPAAPSSGTVVMKRTGDNRSFDFLDDDLPAKE